MGSARPDTFISANMGRRVGRSCDHQAIFLYAEFARHQAARYQVG